MNPTHRAFVVYEHGIPTLYVRLIKALDGCVQSALLWYELFLYKPSNRWVSFSTLTTIVSPIA